MAQTASNFKIIFISIFVVGAVGGILLFSGILGGGVGSGPATVSGTVTVWGTIPNTALSEYLGDFSQRNLDVHVTYIQKDPANFDRALVEAFASGTPPDLVILPDNLLWRFKDKLTHISFASLPAATFQSTFISSSNIFAVNDGYLAIPWATDPLIFYYNWDLLGNAGIATPPVSWKQFGETLPLLTKKTSDLTITQSGAALGTFKNISHAKDIIAMLFMQSNNSFITSTPDGTEILPHFGSMASSTDGQAAKQALTFYTGFANPQKEQYTWNAGLPLDRDMFAESTLAYYFGHASDLPEIHSTNPNLNFGVALPPQIVSGSPITTGTIYGLAIPKIAKDQLLSYTAATLLTNQVTETALTKLAGKQLALLPVRRDVLSIIPTDDPYMSLFYKVALVQKSWLDPDPQVSSSVIESLIKNVTSGILDIDQSFSEAAGQLMVRSAKI